MDVDPAGASQNPVLPDLDWGPLLEIATREVFEIMLAAKLDKAATAGHPPDGGLTAIVGLAGDLSGVICLRCTGRCAARLASKMLGAEIGETDEHVQDALGELCNMVAGNVKARAPELAGCLLSVPTVVSGDDVALFALALGERVEIALRFEEETIWVGLHWQS